MKFFLICLSLIITVSAFADIPSGYYDSASGLTGEALKAALHNIIDETGGTGEPTHNPVTYNSLWTHFQSTDNDGVYENDDTVLDMYSENPDGPDPYNFTWFTDQDTGSGSNEGQYYNREHSFPKSWFNDASPMNTDLFHLYPTDKIVNGQRDNYPFGEVSSPNWTSLNGSKRGPCSYPGYTGTVFEPIDEFKGDFARTYFYMATRYYGEDGSWPGSDMVDGAEPKTWALNMLLEWHNMDGVSLKEINRNNAVYSIQGNRNPFIDHPEYVGYIWGGETPSDVTILSQNFSSGLTPWTAFSVASNKDWSASSGVAEINGYGGDVESEDWLISPSMDLSGYTNQNLTFSSWTQYTDSGTNGLTVKISTDYSGSGSPAGAIWTDLSPTLPAQNSQTWTSSGNVDLSSYAQSGVYIAFVYESSGTGAGTSTYWKVDNIQVTADEPISAPNATSATNITSSSFSANWDAVTEATGYQLDVATDNGFTSFVSGFNNLDVGNVTTYSISGLNPETDYYYRVRAYDGSNTSANSNTITITTNATISAPVATSATNISSSSFTANWNSASGATGYELDVATDNGFTSFVSGYNNLDVGNVTTYSISGLNPETNYYYRVRAYDASNTSSNSNTISVSTSPAGSSHWTESFENPQDTWSSYATGIITFDSGDWDFVSVFNEPLANTGSNATRMDDDTPGASIRTPSINTVGTVTFYYRELNSGGGTFSLQKSYNNSDWSEITTQSFSGTTYTQFTHDVNDSASLIYLRVVNDNQAGHLIIDDFQVTAYSSGSAPSAPVATSATDITASSFTANWNSSSGATSYRLDVATDSGFSSLLGSYNDVTVSSTSQSVTGLSASTDYYYRVRAVNSYGTSGNSDTISVTTSEESSEGAIIILSELCDPQNDYENNRFIEITNIGTTSQDLTGWSVIAVIDDSDGFTWNLSGSISPGQSLVCGDPNASGFTVDFAQTGWAAANHGGSGYWNGKVDDGAKLNDGSKAIVDQIIATGTLFENQALTRNANITEPSGISDENEWTSTSVSNASDASPGSHYTENPLPVTLSSFTAMYHRDSARLYWTTQSELNNSHWNVYRSVSGNFGQSQKMNITGIEGAGTTSNATDYLYEDETETMAEHTYWYWIESVDYSGNTELFSPVSLSIPAEQETIPEIPLSYGLYANYPNPFNPETQISFALEEEAAVSLTIYNVKGKIIRTLLQEEKKAAEQVFRVSWDGKDESGKEVASGVYFYRLQTGSKNYVRKMLLIK